MIKRASRVGSGPKLGPERTLGARSILAALAVLLAGCPGRDGAVSPGPDAAADAGVHDAADATAAAVDADVEAGVVAELPYPDAIRAEDWSAAEHALAKLPDAEKNKPEVRFARGRVAAALGKHKDAVALLTKLEDELPLLRESVLKARATSALEAGPYDEAASWHAARLLPSSWMIAADAWEKAGDPLRARVQCDRVIGAEKKPRALEERARAMRMRLIRAKDGDLGALPDARWLATYALDDKLVETATDLVEKAKKPLDGAELLARSKTLAEAMRSDDALRAVERAAAARTNVPVAIELCRARAEAYWKARTRYAEAALAYRQCSQMGGARAAEDAFLSARAFERADRDGDALPAFEGVIQHHPKTPWADQAAFHIARTHALAGRWKDAARAFDEYGKQFPTGHEKREAERYRAIAHLMAQDHKVARKLLEDLTGGGDDAGARARWADLAALAALHDGDRTSAIARWTEVARSHPLSWAALVARARLTEAKAPLPLTIDPPETGDPPPPLEVELPSPADVLHRIGFDGEAEEALREHEAAVVAKSGGRGTEALCMAYAMLDRGKRRYQVALGVPGAMLQSAPGAKNRWAWECAFPRPHRQWVETSEAEAKLPKDLVWSVMRQESAFDPDVVSPARAVGLLQLLPETAKTVAGQKKTPFVESALTRPSINVALGSQYLRTLLDELHDDVPLAVGAYNAGPEAIQRWAQHMKGIPLDVFVETIPFIETRGYVVRVMGNLARYGFLERGEGGVPHITLDLK